MNIRNYYVLPELTDKKRLLEDALQKAKDGDECTVHYHGRNDICNDLCHAIDLPISDEGKIL